MIFNKIPIILLAAAMSAPTLAVADDDDELEFDEAFIFFELNNTDGDLGIHAKIDGDEWKKLEIEDSKERTMLKINVRGRLKKQGLTELFFESAEPTFDDLDPEKFFKRFPEGTYEIEAETLEGDELESEVEVSHIMPAPPGGVKFNTLDADVLSGEDCVHSSTSVMSPVTIFWTPVTMSHPTIGTPGEAVTIDSYEVVVEIDEETPVLSIVLPSEITEIAIPDAFIALTTEWKFEVLAKLENGNATAVESCFLVVP